MFELILMMSLTPAFQQPLQPVAAPKAGDTLVQVQPCVWPRTCKASETQAVAQVQPCVWPRTCKKDAPAVQPVMTAQFQPCVWPRTCAKPAVVAQFQPCVWPKRCARNDA